MCVENEAQSAVRRGWLAHGAGTGMDEERGGGASSFARDRGPVLWLVSLGADEEVGLVASLCSSDGCLDVGDCRRCSRKVREEALATMQFVPIVAARAHRKVVNGKQGVRW